MSENVIIIEEIHENAESEKESAENTPIDESSFLSTGHFSIHPQPDDEESFVE